MDISQHAVGGDSFGALSKFQINNFFRRHPSITQNDCNQAAAKITASTVCPTPLQGVGSYTVCNETADAEEPRKAVQFRHSTLDLEMINRARQTYGEFVPGCEAHGILGDVHVYVMDFVPGVAFSQARRQLLALDMEARLLQTVKDFARFYASAWRHGIELPPDVAHALSIHYLGLIDKLSQGLPERFQAKLDEVRRGLPLLFRPGYPMVLNHDDLLEMNIHVNTDTGHITGIVDWADAKISPFGVSLGGLETILGVQTSSSWFFHPSEESLRSQFWETFYNAVGNLSDDERRAIEIARLLGLFRTYGFDCRPENENAVPVGEEDSEFVCLEALCLR